jgi:DNA-binding transcriptional ArsR family regulator
MAAPETESQPTLDQLKAKAPEAAAFLRHLANPSRLILLCHIAQGERSVTDIQRDLGFKQPALSQQLADLRRSGLVQTRRESRTIYYAIKDGRARAVMAMLQQIFCGDPAAAAVPATEPLRATSAGGDAAQFARLAEDN